MSDKINLEPTRLKASEFILGVLIGIVASILGESLFVLFGLNQQNALIWALLSFFALIILLLWYKRIIGFPDYKEFSYKFSRNKKFEWFEFRNFFSRRLMKNLKKQGYIGLGVFIVRIRYWILKIDFIEKKFKKITSRIKRTRFGNTLGYIYIEKQRESFTFLLGMSTLSNRIEGIEKAIQDTLDELKDTGYIIKGSKFTTPKYFYKSKWHPIIKKGKQIK